MTTQGHGQGKVAGLEITQPRPAHRYAPPMGEVDVIYADPHLVILDKPSGLLTVPGRAATHKDCLESRARQQFPDIRIVHRLDMDTSGLVVLARSQDVHRNLSKQFEQRQIKKSYLAEVWGHLAEDSGTVDLPLRCDWPNRPLQMVDHALGKPALTHWSVEARAQHSTRVRLTPITGRSHQLRVHMQALGHPILGDVFYARGAALEAKNRLCLHAERLQLRHPTTGVVCRFESLADF